MQTSELTWAIIVFRHPLAPREPYPKTQFSTLRGGDIRCHRKKTSFPINMQILPNARRRDTRKREAAKTETLFFSFCGFILFAIILISLLECSARVLNTLRTFFMLSRSSDDYQRAEYHVWKSLKRRIKWFFLICGHIVHRGNSESEVNTYASQHECKEVKVMSQVVERTRSPGWAAQRQGRRLYQFIMYTQLFQEITR